MLFFVSLRGRERVVSFFPVGNSWTDVRVMNSMFVAEKLGMDAEVDGDVLLILGQFRAGDSGGNVANLFG